MLAVAVIVAYHNALDGEFVFDDAGSIGNNRSLRQAATWLVPPANSGETVAGRPLLNASFGINRALLGEGPRGFHAVNIGIQVLATLALFAFVGRALRGPMLAGRWAARSDGVAASVALLWSVHPLLTESVTYIVQRAESLVGLWVLLALIAFARGAECDERAAADPESRRDARFWWGLSWLATLAGVATKEVAAVVPVLAYLYDAAFVAGNWRAALSRRWRVLAVLATSWVWLAFLVWQTGNRGGTVGAGSSVAPWSYLVTQTRGVWLYLKLCVWPAPLVIDYGTPVWSLAEAWPFAVATCALFGATVWALVRKPAWGFIGAWFFVLLAPSSSFIPISTQTLAEHRMYLPLAAVVTTLVVVLWSRLGRAAWAVVVVPAIAAGVLTIRRNVDYRTAAGMWLCTAEAQPQNPRAWSGYGTLLFDAGRAAESLPYLERGVAAAPGDARYRLTLARGYAAAGKLDAAWREFDEALRLAPNLYAAHMSYAETLVQAGRAADAVPHFEHAVALQPRQVEAQFNLANALFGSGRAGEALPHYEAALALYPDALDVRTNYAGALLAAGRTDAAASEVERVLAVDAKSPQAQWVTAQLALSRNDQARAEIAFRRILAVDPKHRDARYALGQLELAADRPEEAEKHFAEFLKLEPNAAAAHNARGIALAQLGRMLEARDAFARAVALSPDFQDARDNLRRATSELSGQGTR